ncbi:MAG: diaminopimelate decarboxylase [Gammaproteobacteria bacterium]|nr:diaminopimelate decarboxylase [Gammaproteobacteria bacterium]
MRAYRNGVLHVDDVDLRDVASAFGTPCYVYSRRDIEANYRAYDRAFGTRAHRIHYAVKANDNLSILRVLMHEGAAFDIVSGGELARVLAAGGRASDVVFSGVGKTGRELEDAVAVGVACINLESDAELERLAAIAAAARKRVRVAIRVNPDVDPKTHPYISTGLKKNKFGVPLPDAAALYRRIAADDWLEPAGVACHIGSQLTSLAPVVEAVNEVVKLAEALRAEGIELHHIDVGGGLGIHYEADDVPPPVADLVAAVCAAVPARYEVCMEPGRSLVGAAGTLLTTIEYVKATPAKTFAIVDAAMNDLMRPALYEAWHGVLPVERADDVPLVRCDVVGPVCESGDWLARERDLPARPGALLAFSDVGAYGFAMSSNYNARPRPAEVLVDGDRFVAIRRRETLAELTANEASILIP